MDRRSSVFWYLNSSRSSNTSCRDEARFQHWSCNFRKALKWLCKVGGHQKVILYRSCKGLLLLFVCLFACFRNKKSERCGYEGKVMLNIFQIFYRSLWNCLQSERSEELYSTLKREMHGFEREDVWNWQLRNKRISPGKQQQNKDFQQFRGRKAHWKRTASSPGREAHCKRTANSPGASKATVPWWCLQNVCLLHSCPFSGRSPSVGSLPLGCTWRWTCQTCGRCFCPTIIRMERQIH